MPTKVLVVEDNPDVMFVLLSAVDSQKCEFIGVEDGTSVVSTALDERPKLIIIDVMLPGINGLEVCRRIRSMDELKDIKILGISGHVSARDIEPDLFDEFLEKPFEVPVLLQYMARLLGWETPKSVQGDHGIVQPDQDEDEQIDLTWNEGNSSGE